MTGAVFLMGLAAVFTERAYRAGTEGLVVPEPAIAAIGRLVAGAAVLFVLELVRR